jgi:hypothetical protein
MQACLQCTFRNAENTRRLGDALVFEVEQNYSLPVPRWQCQNGFAYGPASWRSIGLRSAPASVVRDVCRPTESPHVDHGYGRKARTQDQCEPRTDGQASAACARRGQKIGIARKFGSFTAWDTTFLRRLVKTVVDAIVGQHHEQTDARYMKLTET